MKYKIKELEAKFQPIKIEITIETYYELENFIEGLRHTDDYTNEMYEQLVELESKRKNK